VVTLPAHLVATPVLERLTPGPHEGVVLGAGATAAWVDLDGFVIAITTREVPLLPNAIAVAAGSGALVGADADAGAGGAARLALGRVGLGSVQVTWDPAAPPGWDPTVPVPSGVTRQAVGGRGAALLRALGAGGALDNHQHAPSGSATLLLWGPKRPAGAEAHVLVRHLVRELGRIGLATAADPEGAAGLTLLFRGIRERDPEPAAAAARELLGRGPGLTPDGDDLLAAVAGTVAVLGPATGMGRSFLRTFLAALVGPAPERTTALSATLLELAAHGLLAEPAGRLLDLSPAGERAWPAALARLRRLGHGSGRAYATGIAAACLLAGAAGDRVVP
jgi:hypothetical protein